MIKTVGLNTTCRLAIELSTILVLALLNSIILSKFDVLLTYYFCRHIGRIWVKGIEDDLLNPNDVSPKLIELEYRSRRNNLRIDGIEEIPNETWEDCETKIQESIKNKLKMNKYIEIHRCQRQSREKTQNRPRTIICHITLKRNKKYLKTQNF